MIGIAGARPGSVAEDRGGGTSGNCASRGRATAKISDVFFAGRIAGINGYSTLARAYGRG